ncbi:MAG TPA: DUF2244 domain-containing protein [Burkholderiales bacterium]|nr:DUF2244 domain-containing protein [Burkholderiales bacterium]
MIAAAEDMRVTGIVREDAAECVYLVRRNNSLSSSERLLVFGFFLVVSIGIAAGFALVFGAWPILPFAGLEMAVLYAAFHCVDCHAADCERITITGNTVSVEVQEGRRVTRRDMNRHWTRVVCASDGSRIALRLHGEDVEVGRHLCATRRRDMAHALERRLQGRHTLQVRNA